MFDVKTGGSGYISTEKSQTLQGIIESFNDTRMLAFDVWDEIKRVALRPLQSHFKKG